MYFFQLFYYDVNKKRVTGGFSQKNEFNNDKWYGSACIHREPGPTNPLISPNSTPTVLHTLSLYIYSPTYKIHSLQFAAEISGAGN